LIGSVPCKVVDKFEDPYKYDPNEGVDGEESAQPISAVSPD